MMLVVPEWRNWQTRLDQSAKKERQFQEQFEAQARLHKEISDLYDAKAKEEGAF